MHPSTPLSTGLVPGMAPLAPVPGYRRLIRDAPRGYRVRTFAKSKSSALAKPHSGRSSEAKSKSASTSTHHQVRRPPSNSSGNIAPLERTRPSTRENRKNEQESSVEEDGDENLTTTTTTTAVATTTELPYSSLKNITHVGNLNAVPLEMLSPALSKNILDFAPTNGASENGATETNNENETILPAVEVIMSPLYRLQNQRKIQQKQQEQQQVIAFPGSGVNQLAELVLGRLALCGGFGTSLVYLFTGQTLFKQILTYPDNIFLVSLAVLSASLVVKQPDNGENSRNFQVQFVPALSSLGVEKWIGRIAMVSFGSVLAWQLFFSTIQQ